MSGAGRRPLSGAAAARIIAGVTLTRMRRGRSLWLAAGLAVLPALVAATALKGHMHGDQAWQRVFDMCQGLLAIIPPLLLASAIGEELEDRTFTYLWSRPFPRQAIVAGKVAAGLPLAVLLVAGAAALAFFAASAPHAGSGIGELVRGAGALAAGAVAVSAVSVGLGGLVPRHALATTIIYMLILDAGVGAMPFSIRKLAIAYHVRVLSGVAFASTEPTVAALAWLAGMTAVWGAIALWRAGAGEPGARGA